MTREDLKPYCISLVTPVKTFYLALKSDEELYSWMDEIYSRSPLMGVSNPTNFVHQVHVGFDPVSGAFTGLPDQWTRLLTSSAITKEDYAKNPQAVLDVLEFYTDIQKRERDDYGLGEPTSKTTGESRSASGATQPARFGAGTGLAGQRSESLGMAGAPRSYPPTLATTTVTQPLRPSAPVVPAGFRPAPRLDASMLSSRAQSPAGRPSLRPNLLPGRLAPAPPSSALQDGYNATGLKPLITSASSRTTVKDQIAPPTPSRTPLSSNQNAASVASPLESVGSSRATGPHTATPPAPAPVDRSIQSIKKTERAEGERRISSMSEAQIMTKLRSVCSPEDPNTLYSKIKKVGQGASGSVYVAKVLANGSKVAIKQMDLSHQPRKELIVNEILVMKESQHPNIVNFLDSFLVKGAELWVVMEFMEGGALTDVIDSNSLEEDQISSISNEVRTLACSSRR